MQSTQPQPEQEMRRIIACWAAAERRAKHLCAFETIGLSTRCRKPSQIEVKKAYHRLLSRLHPDKNHHCDALATEATRCINLAKDHLFDVHFGGAAKRVEFKHEPDREEAQAREAAEARASKEAAEAAEVATAAAQQARLAEEVVTAPATAADDVGSAVEAASSRSAAPAACASQCLTGVKRRAPDEPESESAERE